MRILFLSTWFPFPADNGSKIRVSHLIRSLSLEHEVTLVSLSFGSANPADASALRQMCREVIVIAKNPFARPRTLRALRYLSLAPIATLRIAEVARVVQAVLERESFDIIIASTEAMATYSFLAPSSIPRILEEHNSLTRWMRERYEQETSRLKRANNWISWYKSRLYEARLFKAFDAVVMVSSLDCETSLKELPGYSGRVALIPNGVDCEFNQPGQAVYSQGKLVFNGSLAYYANFDAIRYFLAEVYPLVRKEIVDISLTITGSTEGADMGQLQLDETVRLTGYIPDIRPVVAGARACIAPIREGGGTRLKVLEAMALGTPVVSTSKGAEGLDAIPGVDILVADEPSIFAQYVVDLMRNDELRERLSRNARRLVETKYNWQHIGHEFVRLIDNTVQLRNQL